MEEIPSSVIVHNRLSKVKKANGFSWKIGTAFSVLYLLVFAWTIYRGNEYDSASVVLLFMGMMFYAFSFVFLYLSWIFEEVLYSRKRSGSSSPDENCYSEQDGAEQPDNHPEKSNNQPD